MNKTLIFFATYNEYDNVEKLLIEILNLNLNLDILVVDDNSPDNTKKILKQYSKKFKNIRYIVRPSKLGLDTAHKLAFKYSIKNNYDFLVTMDADLSHNPKDIKRLLNKIKKYDFVIGSRYMKSGKNKMSGFRYVLSFFGNKFIKLFLNIKTVNEFTTSFRCFNVKKLKKINLNNIKASGYSFFMYCIYYFYKKKFKIGQIPIIFNDRVKGKSKIPRIEILRTLINLILIKFKIND